MSLSRMADIVHTMEACSSIAVEQPKRIESGRKSSLFTKPVRCGGFVSVLGG